MSMIESLHDATPAWFSKVLHEAGALPTGAVETAVLHGNSELNSSVGHFALTYSADAPTDAPPKLLLKLNSNGAGEAEIAFYQYVLARKIPLKMLLQSLGAHYDSKSGQSYLLLTDVSDTHSIPVTREQLLTGAGVPPMKALGAIVDNLAAFHAFWWNYPLHGASFGAVRSWYNGQDAYAAHLERRKREWAQFASAGHDIPPRWHEVYDGLLGLMPQFWDAYLSTPVTLDWGMTLTHGDCYLTQFLSPKDGKGQTYIIDFQDVSRNFAVYDLVYLIATFWTTENHQAVDQEMDLLERYHCRLIERRVTHYSIEKLNQDFDIMLALMLFDPVFNAVSGSAENYWRQKMRCLIDLFTMRGGQDRIENILVKGNL